MGRCVHGYPSNLRHPCCIDILSVVLFIATSSALYTREVRQTVEQASIVWGSLGGTAHDAGVPQDCVCDLAATANGSPGAAAARGGPGDRAAGDEPGTVV